MQASQPPEVWAFGISNLVTFLFGTVLAVIAYRTYRREGVVTFLIAAGGFAVLALGTVVEAVFEFGVYRDSYLFGRDLFLVRTIEGAVLAVGWLLLLYSLRRV